MTDYTLSDLPRLAVYRVKRIRVPNPVRHNRQLVGVTDTGHRVVLHTWFCPWGSYSARVPSGTDMSDLRHVTVEGL